MMVAPLLAAGAPLLAFRARGGCMRHQQLTQDKPGAGCGCPTSRRLWPSLRLNKRPSPLSFRIRFSGEESAVDVHRSAKSAAYTRFVSGHGFSRAERTINSTHAPIRCNYPNSRPPAGHPGNSCHPERSRRIPTLPHLCTTAARHSPRARVGRTLLSPAFDLLCASINAPSPLSFRIRFSGEESAVDAKSAAYTRFVSGHGFSRAERTTNSTHAPIRRNHPNSRPPAGHPGNSCHPERSIPIRPANRDAKSKSLPWAKPKDPNTPTPLHHRRKAFSPRPCGADTPVRRLWPSLRLN